MSMSLHVEGFRPPDERFHKMLDAYRSCEEAGVPIPQGVLKFFNGEAPDPKGVVVEIGPDEGRSNYNEEASEGYEVDLTKLPKGITTLRFTANY